MYQLYYHPFSQHARRVIALLEAENIPYQKELVDLGKGEHLSPSFLTLNPNHQVPVLVQGDFVLSESHAILRYLCQQHRLEHWYPTDTQQRAMVDQWLDWAHCKWATPVMNIVLNRVFLGDKGDPAAIAQGLEKLEILTPILDQALHKQSYICGEHPTLADLALGSHMTQLQVGQAFPESSAIQSWYERLCTLPGFQRRPS